MSYDIYFINSDKVSSENVGEFLELEVSEKDDHFISKAVKNEIKADLAGNGLSFETFESQQDDYVELSFETYQISMTNSEIAVLLPYWDINGSDAISNDVKLLSKVPIGRGFTGYDPQTERLFTDPNPFFTDFGHVNENVKEHFSSDGGREKKSELWRLVKLSVVVVAAFLFMKLLFAILSRVF